LNDASFKALNGSRIKYAVKAFILFFLPLPHKNAHKSGIIRKIIILCSKYIDVNDRYTVEHRADIVLLHACGPSQRQTAEEPRRHRPALGQRSVGGIYSRFQGKRGFQTNQTDRPRTSSDAECSTVVLANIE
jgi:hypothetical protein